MALPVESEGVKIHPESLKQFAELSAQISVAAIKSFLKGSAQPAAEGDDELDTERHAAGSTPSGTNGFTPGMTGSEDNDDMHPDQEAAERYCADNGLVMHARDIPAEPWSDGHAPDDTQASDREEREQYARAIAHEAAAQTAASMAKDLRQKDERIAQLERYNRQIGRTSDLKDLHDAGYQFDPETELAEVLDLPESAYQKHMERIRERYARDTTLEPIHAVAPRDQKPGSDVDGLTAQDAQAIVKYARDKKIDDHKEAVTRYLADFEARYRQTGRPA
jgi:hypothetical protein